MNVIHHLWGKLNPAVPLQDALATTDNGRLANMKSCIQLVHCNAQSWINLFDHWDVRAQQLYLNHGFMFQPCKELCQQSNGSTTFHALVFGKSVQFEPRALTSCFHSLPFLPVMTTNCRTR
eukprot:3071375-Amphidinium_carterae.1